MKKILLSAVALVASMNVNAQEWFAVTDAGTADYLVGEPTKAAKNKTELTYWEAIEAGTVLGETDNVTCTLLLTQDLQKAGLSSNDIQINGEDFGSDTGIQGFDNVAASASSAEAVYPAAGYVLSFKAKKNGFLYIIHKASQNKNYVAWGAKQRIPYYMSVLQSSGVYNFDLNKVEGATKTVGGAAFIADGYAILQPIDYNDKITAGGTSVVLFPVVKNAQYDFHATGSKVTFAGFVFSETDDVKIAQVTKDAETGAVTGETILIDENYKSTSGINGITADAVAAAPAVKKVVENGQVVIIKGGKKFNVAGAQLK